MSERYSVRKHWVKYRKAIRDITPDEFKKILLKGRFPNNNTFPPLYRLKPKYKYSNSKIVYLCPRANNAARKYVIPDNSAYQKFVAALSDCWTNSDTNSGFSDPKTIKELVLSNRKIIPISSSFLRSELSRLQLDEIYRDSIYKWKEFTQRYLYEDSVKHNYLLNIDIKDFYQQIYVHSITWALSGDKERCKVLRKSRNAYKNLYASKLENSIMDLQDRQTNGIPIGSLGSDIVAEIVMSRIVNNVERKLKNINFIGIRFKDDFKILSRKREDAEKILDAFVTELYEYDLYVNEDKTSILTNFSSLVMKSWHKKLLSLPKANINLDQKFTYKELLALDNEYMGILIMLTETLTPSDGNFWYEFEKVYLKNLKKLAKLYPESKKRIIVWLLKQLSEYSQHTGIILDIIMSFIQQRDSTYLKMVRDAGKSISQKRNYDFIMIWVVYFVAENYLSKKYANKFNKIIDQISKEVDHIHNTDIKNEAKNLLNYIIENRNSLKGHNPITKTFKLQHKYSLQSY